MGFYSEYDPFREPQDMPEGYDVAQVCGNGHMITTMARTQPEFSEKFCKRCGARTYTECTKCSAPIRGHYHMRGVIGGFDDTVPSFCHECGDPYPWTREKLAAAREYIAEMEEITPEERTKLSESLDDLVRETPRSPVAVSRVKKAVGRLTKPAAEAFQKIIVDITAATVKRMMTGS